MSILHEISEKIKFFELETGLKPNIIFLNKNALAKIDRILKSRSGLIVYYPDIFSLVFKRMDSVGYFSVGVVSNAARLKNA